jgi:hypothetical protein
MFGSTLLFERMLCRSISASMGLWCNFLGLIQKSDGLCGCDKFGMVQILNRIKRWK